MSLLPLSLVLLGAGAGLAPQLAPLLRARLPLLLAAIPAALAVAFAQAADGGWSIAWAPSLGVELHLRLDGLSRLFAVLICAIGALVLVYSGAYLRGHPRLGGFCTLLLAFLAAMLGLVLADDVVGLFVFWEATSLTSFLLVGFEHERRAARRGALQALVVTAGGGLALLAGLLLAGQEVAGQEVGTWRLSELASAGELLRGSPVYGGVLALVLAGAFTKSAQVPVHFWLPNAMAAPTPVSALLHSSTMVKAGVYLLARLHPGLGGTPAWTVTLTAFGAVTLVVGAALALRDRDSKGMLACTTVASLGLLVLLLGVGTATAVKAALLYLVAHAAFKGGLFLVAGGIDHCGGGRDVTRVAGLRRVAPGLALAGGLAALSMAGLPPATGFLAKEVLYEALTAPDAALPWLLAVVLGNALMVAAAVQVGVLPFLGAPTGPEALRAERTVGGAALWAPALVLAVAGAVAPLFPALLAAPLAAAATAVR
ncbi:MAG: proton-conducting transporter membrane subunit, partial [Pseudomonadales bacterium]|nr:proton-conducting transporter membrane subunit [Pseudomonadales bacterium]